MSWLWMSAAAVTYISGMSWLAYSLARAPMMEADYDTDMDQANMLRRAAQAEPISAEIIQFRRKA